MQERVVEFHRLVEIAVNLDKSLDDVKRLATTATKKKATFWINKLHAWVVENYERDGIIERRYNKWFGDE